MSLLNKNRSVGGTCVACWLSCSGCCSPEHSGQPGVWGWGGSGSCEQQGLTRRLCSLCCHTPAPSVEVTSPPVGQHPDTCPEAQSDSCGSARSPSWSLTASTSCVLCLSWCLSPPICAQTTTASLLSFSCPEGLCTCCSFCLEFCTPVICVAGTCCVFWSPLK